MKMCLVVTLGLAGALSSSAPLARATSFLTQTVDAAGVRSAYETSLCNLAVDSQGRAHVAYSSPAGLRYASETPSGWTVEGVPTGATAVFGIALALDHQDHPVIAFWSTSPAPLCYRTLGSVTNPGSGWVSTTILDCSIGEGISMGLDPDGRPHVTYSSGRDGMHHVSPVGESWSDEFVYSQTDYYPEMSLVLDDEGRPHLAAQLLGVNWVRYSVKDAGVWAHETVEPLSSSRYFVSLALDASGAPYLAYMDTGTNSLRFASRTASGWTPMSVPGATAGTHTSLAINSDGDPRIAYSDGQLRYASREGGAWSVESVAHGGTYASLKLDANDAPRIAYVGDHGVQYSRGIACNLTFAPGVLNARRQGPWITVYLETSDFDLSSVDVSSIRLNGTVAPEPKFSTIGDANANGVPDLMLKFASESVTALLHEGSNDLVATGSLLTGDEFETGGSIQFFDPTHAAGTLTLLVVSRAGMDRVAYVVGGDRREARVQVFDVQGRLVRSWDGVRVSEAVRTWDGTRSDGVRVGSGVYFIRADAEGLSAVRRVVMKR